MSTAIEKIEELAVRVAEDALENDVKLADKVEALKVLKDIYVVQMKHKDKQPADEDENDFNGFRSQINAAEEVNRAPAEVRSGRRRRAVS